MAEETYIQDLMYFHIVRYRQGLVGRHHREGVNFVVGALNYV